MECRLQASTVGVSSNERGYLAISVVDTMYMCCLGLVQWRADFAAKPPFFVVCLFVCTVLLDRVCSLGRSWCHPVCLISCFSYLLEPLNCTVVYESVRYI